MIPIVAPLLAACAAWGHPPTRVPPAVEFGRAYDVQNPFAAIVRHRTVVPIVFEDRHVIAFLDHAPVSPGHVLVISKDSRARNLLEVSDRDLSRLMRVARRVGRAEIGGLGADGFTIEQNNGLPQSVPHLHIHVIPRYAGYNRCNGGILQSDTVLQPFAARLRVAMSTDRGEPVPSKPADDTGPPPVTAAPQPAPDTSPQQ